MTKGNRHGGVFGRWAPWLGGLAVLGVLAWVLRGLDLDRLQAVIVNADPFYLIVLVLSLALEQVARAWKWRQILHRAKPVATLRLFGVVMAGYLGNMVIPVGPAPLIRAWLVARLEGLTIGAVLATVVVDRLVDGFVFAALVIVFLAVAAFPDATGEIRTGLLIGGVGSLTLWVLVVLALPRYKRQAAADDGWPARLSRRLPERLKDKALGLARSFADGILWPGETWRRVAVIAASAAIKAIAASHFLWTGLAFGILLAPADYVFLLIFLGFLIVLTHVARIPGGFMVGGVFLLDRLGVGEEEALAMVLTLQTATFIVVAVLGGLALWRFGLTFGDLKARKEEAGKTI